MEVEEIDKLWKASYERERKLEEEYMRTHKISSRGIVLTPEIEAEHAERKWLFCALFVRCCKPNKNPL